MTTDAGGSPSPNPSPNHPAVRRSATAAATPPQEPVVTAAVPRPIAERCDHCGAPVEHSQRYCVQCGAHQRRADDPTARWFASARRAKAAPAALPAGAGAADAGRTVSAGVAAVLIALLPLAAGVGVIVGRGSDDSGKQVVEALKAVGGGGVAAAGVASTTADAANASSDDASSDSASASSKGKKVDGVDTGSKQAPILATGPSGSARQLTGSKPTAKDVAESKKALKDIQAKKGDAYVEQQKDLPDTIVVP